MNNYYTEKRKASYISCKSFFIFHIFLTEQFRNVTLFIHSDMTIHQLRENLSVRASKTDWCPLFSSMILLMEV